MKRSQSTGKLDSGMRGPYCVTGVLPKGRDELCLVAGSYGKTTQATAEYMVLWRGEWTPDTYTALRTTKTMMGLSLDAQCWRTDGLKMMDLNPDDGRTRAARTLPCQERPCWKNCLRHIALL